MKKRGIAIFLCFAMAFQTPVAAAETEETGQVQKAEKIEIVQRKPVLEDLSRSAQTRIRQAVEACHNDGRTAALYLNRLKEDTEAFEMGLREVLDAYYGEEKLDKEQLQQFALEVDGAGQEILGNYEEAAKERENAKELPYETEKVLVAFPNGTPMETIETVVANEAVDYELIDDGNVEIPEDLPEYRKKKLEKIKDRKSDILVLADIELEDTVARSSDKFEAYSCVVSATENSYFEPDGTVTSKTGTGSATLSDPAFDNTTQWHMYQTNVPQAWARFSTIDDIFETWVAVIDCGVQMSHGDLQGILLKNYSVDVTQSNKKLVDCADKEDDKGQYTSGHGTRVAGIIAAKANNGSWAAGVASVGSVPQFSNSCKIMAIKADKTYNEDRHITKAHLAAAINYAVDHTADVINISYSAPKGDYTDSEYTAVKNAIANAIDTDTVVVCSAGNDGSTALRYPAAYDGVIGVGASYWNGEMADYSNESSAVDIIAPGGNNDGKKIYSIRPTTLGAGLGYFSGQGTSFAAPQVAATAAMMLSINPALSPAQILSRLKARSTSTIQGKQNKNKSYPFLNVGNSVAKTNP